MDVNDSGLERLSRDECIRLLGSVSLGRVVYTRQALPAVEVVSFAVDGEGDIVISTDPDGKLAAASNTVVAFEADNADSAAGAGWSVTVVGYARAVAEADEVRRLERSGPRLWGPGKHDHFIKVTPTIVNGRRIRVQRLAG